MKRLLILSALAAASTGIFTAESHALPSNAYDGLNVGANGIAHSKHNLGALNTTNGIHTPGTTEICVFCHTPHHTYTAVSPAPLWNRVNASTNFIAYGSTLGGSGNANINILGSVSQACLSCHDGLTALDNLVNAPGAGGVNPAGAVQAWRFYDMTWTGGAVGNLGVSPTIAFDPRLNIGSGPATGGYGLNNTNGVDLSNDHPMSIAYQPNRASLRPKNTILSAIDLTSGMSLTAEYAANLGQNKWAIKGYVSNAASIQDLLRGVNDQVECSSCHDPHFSNQTGASADQGFSTATSSPDGLFLRRVGGNVGSGLCRTCHNK